MKYKKGKRTKPENAEKTRMRKKELLSKKEIVTMLVIFLAAFLVRSVYLYQSGSYATLSMCLSDSGTYDEAAKQFVKEGTIAKEFFWHGPFYPFFLSILYMFSNCSLIFAKIIQMALGALTVLLVYLCAKDIWGRASGLAASGIVCFYLPLAFFEGELFAAGPAALFAILLIILFIRIKDNPGYGICFATGLCAAAAILNRPDFFLFLIAAFVMLLVYWFGKKADNKKSMYYLLFTAAGFLTLVLPVSYCALQVTGRFSFLPYSSGLNFFIGNNPDFAYTITLRPGFGWERLVHIPGSLGISGDFTQDRYFSGRAWEFVFSQPLDFISGLMHKTIRFLSPREIPRNLDMYMFRQSSPFLFAGLWKLGNFGFPFGIFFPLAALGLWVKRRSIPWPVWLFVIFYPVAVIAVFVASRYRMPLVPILAIPAGAAVIWLAGCIRGKHWTHFLVSLLSVAALGFIISLAGPFIEEKMDLKAEFSLSEGMYYKRIGKESDAVKAFEKAIGYAPDYAEAHYMLGTLLFELDNTDDAVAHLNRVLEIPLSRFFSHTGLPENDAYVESHKEDFVPVHGEVIADTHQLLGNISLKKQKYDDAKLHLEEAYKFRPEDDRLIETLGDVGLKREDWNEAKALFLKTLSLRKPDDELCTKLAFACEKSGDLDNAALYYEKAAELKPGNQIVLYSLANIYFTKGDIKKAIGKYNHLLKLTPYSIDVYLKIGQCYRMLGDIDSAEWMYVKALEINPNSPEVQKALKDLPKKK